MATGDRIDHVRPRDLCPEGTILEAAPLVASGNLLGVPLEKLDSKGFSFHVRVPTNGTPLSTGLTFQLALVDDPNNSDPGKVVRIGIAVKVLASGTDDLTTTGAGTEQFFTGTMNATTGVITLVSAAIANANLDSAAAGSLLLVRIRRNGSNAADTHNGRVLLTNITVSDT